MGWRIEEGKRENGYGRERDGVDVHPKRRNYHAITHTHKSTTDLARLQITVEIS